MAAFDYNLEITRSSVLEVPIKELAEKRSAQGLDFSETANKLVLIQNWLSDTIKFEFTSILSPDDCNQVIAYIDELIQRLEWLRVLDFGTLTSAPRPEFEAYVAAVNALHTRAYNFLFKDILPLLRDEIRRKNPDNEKIEEELKKIVGLRKDLEREVNEAKTEAEKIRSGIKDEGVAKGDRASLLLAVYFDDEVNRYTTSANRWLSVVMVGYGIVLFFLYYLGTLTEGYIEAIIEVEKTIPIKDVWFLIISKIVILAALWFGLSFLIKNFNVNSHLAAVNRHRAAVARTLADFIVAEQSQEAPRLSEMLQSATNAMFKNSPIGFVSKTEKEASNPVLQIVNDVMGLRQ